MKNEKYLKYKNFKLYKLNDGWYKLFINNKFVVEIVNLKESIKFIDNVQNCAYPLIF